MITEIARQTIIALGQHAQMSAFVWIAEQYGHNTEWLMFCDSDEFSFGTDTDDFREVLAQYEDYGGLFLNWQEFGHCDLRTRPTCLCIEAYTRRMMCDAWSLQSGKSVVKPRELLRPYAPDSANDKLGYSFLSPHMFKTNKPTVHTDFTPVNYSHWWLSDHSCHDVAVCNHYRIRSLEDWVAKCARGNCNDANSHYHNALAEWENAGYYPIVDTTALRFAERVKEVLQR